MNIIDIFRNFFWGSRGCRINTDSGIAKESLDNNIFAFQAIPKNHAQQKKTRSAIKQAQSPRFCPWSSLIHIIESISISIIQILNKKKR